MPHLVPGQPDNDQVQARGANAIFALHDLPVPGIHVQAVTTYVSTSGADIIGDPTHTTTILGRNRPDNLSLIAALNSPLIAPGAFNSYYDVPHQGQILVLYVDIVEPHLLGRIRPPVPERRDEPGRLRHHGDEPVRPDHDFNSTGPLTGTPTFLGQEVAYLFGTYDQGVRPPALARYEYDALAARVLHGVNADRIDSQIVHDAVDRVHVRDSRDRSQASVSSSPDLSP